jgi:hypothetical protein
LLVALLRYVALRGAAVSPRYMQGGLRRTSTQVPRLRPLISHHERGAADSLPYLVRVSGAGVDAKPSRLPGDRAAVGARRKRRRRAAPARVGPAGAPQVRGSSTTDRRLPPEQRLRAFVRSGGQIDDIQNPTGTSPLVLEMPTLFNRITSRVWGKMVAGER